MNAAHLYKRFGDKVVLEDVSLTVPDGAVVCLMAPSGRGKTTLLRCPYPPPEVFGIGLLLFYIGSTAVLFSVKRSAVHGLRGTSPARCSSSDV